MIVLTVEGQCIVLSDQHSRIWTFSAEDKRKIANWVLLTAQDTAAANGTSVDDLSRLLISLNNNTLGIVQEKTILKTQTVRLQGRNHLEKIAKVLVK